MERSDGTDSSFSRARDMLLGAVDTVLQLATKDNSSRASTTVRQQASCSTSSSALSEHRRLFGFKPKADCTSKRKGKAKCGAKKPGRSTWKKECICLCDSQQTWKPSPEEKMELAKMGLGLCELTFSTTGDAEHIHRVLVGKFPVLDTIGGYTLLRLGENSRSLIEIETPEGGLTVPYLKDILNQAKLFVRPLQCDISEDDMRPFISKEVYEIVVLFLVKWLAK